MRGAISPLRSTSSWRGI